MRNAVVGTGSGSDWVLVGLVSTGSSSDWVVGLVRTGSGSDWVLVGLVSTGSGSDWVFLSVLSVPGAVATGSPLRCLHTHG